MRSSSRRSFLFGAGASVAAMPASAPGGAAGEGGRYAPHPDFKPDKRITEIFQHLSAPLHARRLRDARRRVAPAGEADVSAGYSLEFDDPRAAKELTFAVADFHRFMSVSMEVNQQPERYAIRVRTAAPPDCPAGAPEGFHLDVSGSSCQVTASDAEGIRRALIYLEDEMLARRGPFLPLGSRARWAVVEDRITRSPVAPYRWLGGWELEHDAEYYPDEYLNTLAHCGMNGIWVAGLLSRLIASRTLPELGPESHRLERLKALTDRAARYGIKVYLFLIEPRAMPQDHPVFAAHPEIRGARGQCLCVSTPLVQSYIRESMRELFTEAPKLAGIINIFNGERLTTCWLNEKYAETCPRCRERKQEEVLADDLNCFMEGIREASATAKLLAWGYHGDQATDFRPFLERVRPDIVWMGNFEHGGEKMVDGRPVKVHEYSLSSVGPSDVFASVVGDIVERGRQAYAKLQVGTTYELSSVPYIPVPQAVYGKLAALHRLKVKGAMLSWIIGGYPSFMLKAAGEASFAPLPPQAELLERVAALDWGPPQAAKIVEAWDRFSRTFGRYLCSTSVFYFGPITRCPAYHLHLEQESQIARPYNWGLTRDRIRQPFEDKAARWLGPFTAEELIASFRTMGAQWAPGVAILGECLKPHRGRDDLHEQYAVAAAARLQFLSMANVIEFYTLRDRLKAGSGTPADLVRRMRVVVEDDIGLAAEMKRYVRRHAAIGFESEIYDYSYSEALLDQKIRHDDETVRTLRRWEKSGVEPEVLARVLPISPSPSERPPARPTWRDWLRWGD